MDGEFEMGAVFYSQELEGLYNAEGVDLAIGGSPVPLAEVFGHGEALGEPCGGSLGVESEGLVATVVDLGVFGYL